MIRPGRPWVCRSILAILTVSPLAAIQDDSPPDLTVWTCDESGRCLPPIGWPIMRGAFVGYECATGNRIGIDEIGACE